MEETKYYRRNIDIIDCNFDEITLNRDNWWYVQLDASIRTIFLKYKLKLPKYVIVQFLHKSTDIFIVRSNFDEFEQAKNWYLNRVFVIDEIAQQAEANSHDDYVVNIRII